MNQLGFSRRVDPARRPLLSHTESSGLQGNKDINVRNTRGVHLPHRGMQIIWQRLDLGAGSKIQLNEAAGEQQVWWPKSGKTRLHPQEELCLPNST